MGLKTLLQCVLDAKMLTPSQIFKILKNEDKTSNWKLIIAKNQKWYIDLLWEKFKGTKSCLTFYSYRADLVDEGTVNLTELFIK